MKCAVRAASISLFIYLFAICSPRVSSEVTELTHEQKQAIVDFVWKKFGELFYDTNFRGVNWDKVHHEYSIRIDEVHTRQQMADLIRQMVASLHNSHSGFLTDEEIRRTKHVLPFFFESVSGRIFVSYVFQPRQPDIRIPLQYGDEITSIDGQAPNGLKLPTVFWVEPVLSNPYYGPEHSTATLTIRRRDALVTVQVPRMRRFKDVMPLSVQNLDAGVTYLRFLKMDEATIPLATLGPVLQQALKAKALIIDLRHCVGGDQAVLAMVGGMLLGSGIEMEKEVSRSKSSSASIVKVERTSDFGATYKGKVILLVDGNTESGPEVLTAALKELGRVKILGTTTRGAFNGYMEGVDVPFNMGVLAVPVDRSLSPHGKEYEGVGVAPDRELENGIEDFHAGRDSVMEAAIRAIRGF